MSAPFPRPLVGALGLTLLLAACGPRTAAPGPAARGAGGEKQPVEVAAITRRDLNETLSLVGSLAPNETAQIRAEIAGQVRSVAFDEGQHVTRGQVLLQIDDAELRAQLAQSEARFRLAELNLKRSDDLTLARSMSQAEADRARSDYATAEAEIQLLRVRLDKMAIKAPFDGIVGSRTISPGDYVTPATTITTLDDLSRMKVDFQVPERFSARVRPGSRFTLRTHTPDGEVATEGEVYFASSVIERATRSSQVKGLLPATPAGLRPGMFANIDIILQTRRQVLTVPEGSILTIAAGTQVIAVRQKDGGAVAEFVPVQLGLREKGLVEITPLQSGTLTEAHSVVASGVGGLALYPGIRLEPRPLRAEFRLGD